MRPLLKLICLAVTLLLSTGNIFLLNAQEKTVSIHAQNVPISEVLDEIEKQTGYMFVYNSNEIDLERRINADIQNGTMAAVLKAVLEGTDITYAQHGQNIMLMLKKDSAQTGTSLNPVRGTVMDTDGNPIIGAGVVIKGTTTGAVTDLDGRFSFQGGESGTLTVSYIGYKDEEVQYTNKRELFIVMKEDSELLDEVVVVGFGTQKKESVIGAIQSV